MAEDPLKEKTWEVDGRLIKRGRKEKGVLVSKSKKTWKEKWKEGERKRERIWKERREGRKEGKEKQKGW